MRNILFLILWVLSGVVAFWFYIAEEQRNADFDIRCYRGSWLILLGGIASLILVVVQLFIDMLLWLFDTMGPINIRVARIIYKIVNIGAKKK